MMSDGMVDWDFLTGTRGASRFPVAWTVDTIFHQKPSIESFGKEKVCETA